MKINCVNESIVVYCNVVSLVADFHELCAVLYLVHGLFLWQYKIFLTTSLVGKATETVTRQLKGDSQFCKFVDPDDITGVLYGS